MSKMNNLLFNNHYWQRFANWYELRPSRDKKIMLLLIATMVAGLFYFLAWQPVTEWTHKQKLSFVYQEEMHRWLHSNLPKAQELLITQQASSGKRDLSSSAASTAKLAGVTLGRVQPDSKGLSVWVEDAPYQKLLSWLVQLQTNQGVSIQQIRIDKLQEEGRVKCFIRLAS